jgi:hypothetical protein
VPTAQVLIASVQGLKARPISHLEIRREIGMRSKELAGLSALSLFPAETWADGPGWY